MPIQWTDAVLNAQAAGSWSPPDTVVAATGDPGADGTANNIAGSSTAVVWEAPGVEGPKGASQPATVGKSYAAPTIELGSESATWIVFKLGSTFQGRLYMGKPATGTVNLSLAIVA